MKNYFLILISLGISYTAYPQIKFGAKESILSTNILKPHRELGKRDSGITSEGFVQTILRNDNLFPKSKTSYFKPIEFNHLQNINTNYSRFKCYLSDDESLGEKGNHNEQHTKEKSQNRELINDKIREKINHTMGKLTP